jgi:CubicO group peptidase (beta-lactamase class C family)
MALALLIVPTLAAAQSPAPNATPAAAAQGAATATLPSPGEPNVARMESLIRQRVDDKSFMGAVLVARGDQVLLSRGYGSANLEWNIPNTPSTKFRLGSITKQFTAAAILLLAERGKLALEDPIEKHWPNAPDSWEAVTIFHLLTHSAGVPNVTANSDFLQWKNEPSTPEQTIAHVRDKPLEFAPGERMSYSNTGYVALGLLVERVSGQSYADFLRDNVFEPLGMNDSGYDVSATILPQRASGYGPGFVNAPYTDMTVPHGAGALYSTTEDLLRWTQGLFGGKLLSAASLEKMITPFKGDYAFGVGVSNAGGRKAISHGGGIEGFNTNLTYYPDSRITVAVLGNVMGTAPAQIAGQLGAIAHGEAIRLSAERTAIELPRDKLERLVGSYELTPMATMRITVVGTQLQSQLGAQPVVPLFAESETVFFPRVVDAELTFELEGGTGKATALTLRQNGQERRAPRIAERTEIDVPAAVLARYPGTYRLRDGFDLVVTLENGQLVSQATGQAKAPLFAEAEDKFFLKVANAQIEFVREAERVTALVLKQGGQEIRAARQ